MFIQYTWGGWNTGTNLLVLYKDDDLLTSKSAASEG
jgi:hypothetical protein